MHFVADGFIFICLTYLNIHINGIPEVIEYLTLNYLTCSLDYQH